jgi:ATP-dependent protease ClpP protease subunit
MSRRMQRARAYAPGAKPAGARAIRAESVKNGAPANVLYIDDVIDPYADDYWGGISAVMVKDALSEMSGDMTVRINSPGGDVYDGITILNYLRQYDFKVTVQIDGLAASAASFIAMAGDEVVIMPNAEMMIHDALMFTIGNAAELRNDADRLDKISDNIANAYSARAGGEPKAWRKLMLAETWFSDSEAVAAGLADKVGELPESRGGRAAANAVGNTWSLPYASRYSGRTEAPAPEIADRKNPGPPPQPVPPDVPPAAVLTAFAGAVSPMENPYAAWLSSLALTGKVAE